ncbi:MAG TPA: hypothetical protein VGW40_05770 [Allosphingosinicella sp.]|nr:hypothetical protein [Allosphingosinicella sp.]
MPNIPLGIQSYDRPSGFEPEVQLVNFYMEKDESGASPDQFFRIQRPGLTLFAELPDPVRGLYRSDGTTFNLPLVASGGELYEIDGATQTPLGDIGSDGDTVSIAASTFHVAAVSAGVLFLYDGETLSAIEPPSGEEWIGVEAIKSYFILPMADGTFFWIEPGATEIKPLNFATAESAPDGLIGVRRLNDELFFFGVSSTEVWQMTGDANLPFAPASGRNFDKGCLSRDTIHNFDNSVVFVGNDGIVYRVGGVPERISTFGIEERMRKRADLPSAFTFSHDAHKFYVLRIPGQGTFAYDAATQLWSEFATYGETVWKPYLASDLSTGAILADSGSGKIWAIDGDNGTDDGEIIQRIVTASVPLIGAPIRNDNFLIRVGASEACNIRLRWADGGDDFPDDYETLLARAPTDIVYLYRLGAATQPTRTFEISCIDEARIRISGASVNDGRA